MSIRTDLFEPSRMDPQSIAFDNEPISWENASMELKKLDHFVVCINNFDDAGERYSAMGFKVIPKMRHVNFGSANRVVQFESTYVELFGDIDKIEIESYRNHYNSRLQLGEGFANASFSGSDLDADRRVLIEMGIDCDDVGSAARNVPMPDETTIKSRSSFFYPQNPEAPFNSPFISAHPVPEAIFSPAWRGHKNTAEDIIGYTCVSDDLTRDTNFFAAVAGGAKSLELGRAGRVRLQLADGDFVDLFSREQANLEFGEQISLPAGLASMGFALTIRVTNLSVLTKVLDQNGVSYTRQDRLVRVPHFEACGVCIDFVSSREFV